jgi:capsular exopolysaccharide synthesis family protein
MLRVAKLRHSLTNPKIRSTTVPIQAEALDPWQPFRRPDLVNTVRQICTLSGWAQAPSEVGRTLGVTSAVQGEGKSSLSRAIAISTARDHANDVLLIECDLLRPSLAADFELAPDPGLGEILDGQAELGDCVRATELPNLWLLPAGNATGNPSRLLRSTAITDLLQEARRRYSFIVVDLPAVLHSNDAAVLAEMTDGVVLVVRARATEQGAVQKTLQLLANATVHGVVLNRWQSAVPRLIRRIIEQ